MAGYLTKQNMHHALLHKKREDVLLTLITNYVNYHTLPSLLEETPAGNEQYYKGLLGSIRRLLVFCEE
ncbi:DUF3907 family protein, partial [Bacillus sp. D-CC]